MKSSDFSSEDKLKKHKKMHKKSCDICGEKFKTKLLAEKHKRLKHKIKGRTKVGYLQLFG